MTEIPEHLLKRSQAAKAKASGAEAPADAAAPSSSAPAKVEAATPAVARPAKSAPAAAPLPLPDIPVVVAAKARKRIPFWAMATLSILPVWMFMYARALTPNPVRLKGPLADGATIYKGNCSTCHGADGAGGAGRILYQGEVLKTFPRIEDQLNFVYWGSQGYIDAKIAQYGDPKREGGAHAPLSYNGVAVMPKQGLDAGGPLTDYQILAVVCHERYTLGGADPTSEQWQPEYDKWCSASADLTASLKSSSVTFASDALKDVGAVARPSLGGAK